MTVDLAAITLAVWQRNKQRAEANLPLLNVKEEIAHEVALCAERDYGAYAEQFAEQIALIEAEVQAALLAEHGRDFRTSQAFRWALTANTQKRFRQYLEEVHGIKQPPLASKRAILYGEGRGSIAVAVQSDEDK